MSSPRMNITYETTVQLNNTNGSPLRQFKKIPEDGFNPQCFMKRNHFPTAEERAFFFRNVVISTKDLETKRMNEIMAELPPFRMRILNLSEHGILRLIHAANIFDILIRMVIQNAGGNLEDTRYTINISDYGDSNFSSTHKTYQQVDGGETMNARLELDESHVIEMFLFVDEKSIKDHQISNASPPNPPTEEENN